MLRLMKALEDVEIEAKTRKRKATRTQLVRRQRSYMNLQLLIPSQ